MKTSLVALLLALSAMASGQNRHWRNRRRLHTSPASLCLSRRTTEERD